MDFNQNQDLNNQFTNNEPNHNVQNNKQVNDEMQQPLNANTQAQLVQQNTQQNQQPHAAQPQPVMFNIHIDLNQKDVFGFDSMQQPSMPKMMQGLLHNLYHGSKFTDPYATESELQQELDKLQDSVDHSQKANLIQEIKQYLTKQSYKKEIPFNIKFCIKALGMMKCDSSIIALQETKKKFDDDTTMLFSSAGSVLVGLTCCCCLCCFTICILLACQKCGNFLPDNHAQLEDIKKLIDSNLALCQNKQF